MSFVTVREAANKTKVSNTLSAGMMYIAECSPVARKGSSATGLHSAMYIIPALGVLLTLVLFAASRTVTKDMEELQRWMRESTAADALAESAAFEAADASALN